jgi:hypothetical protein
MVSRTMVMVTVLRQYSLCFSVSSKLASRQEREPYDDF